MTDSSSDCEEAQAISVLVPELLRLLLPETPPDQWAHPAESAPAQPVSATSRADTLLQREDAAQTLWDLTASATHAQIAVDCMGLDILPVVIGHALNGTQHRLAELSLGIMANIMCHAALATQASLQQDFRLSVISTLMTEPDTACLAETFRLLAAAVSHPGGELWLADLQGIDSRLKHIMWITDNTLNRVLLERCLKFVLAAGIAQQQLLSSYVLAGIMPILVDVLSTYATAVKEDAATNTQCESDRSDGGYSGGSPPHSHVPSGAAIVACATLLQLLIQDCPQPQVLSSAGSLSRTVVQLLDDKEFLHQRGLIQGQLVVLLACIDSSLWLGELVSKAEAVEAVFEAMLGEFGFEELPSDEEVRQGQEAAWAVLAAISRHFLDNRIPRQILDCLVDHSTDIVSQELVSLSPQAAGYTARSLVRAADKDLQAVAAESNDGAQDQLIVLREALQEAKQTELAYANCNADCDSNVSDDEDPVEEEGEL